MSEVVLQLTMLRCMLTIFFYSTSTDSLPHVFPPNHFDPSSLLCLNNHRGTQLLRRLGVRPAHIPHVRRGKLSRRELLRRAQAAGGETASRAAELAAAQREAAGFGNEPGPIMRLLCGMQPVMTGAKREAAAIIGNRRPWCQEQLPREPVFYRDHPALTRQGAAPMEESDVEEEEGGSTLGLDDSASESTASSSQDSENGGSVGEWNSDDGSEEDEDGPFAKMTARVDGANPELHRSGDWHDAPSSDGEADDDDPTSPLVLRSNSRRTNLAARAAAGFMLGKGRQQRPASDDDTETGTETASQYVSREVAGLPLLLHTCMVMT